MSASIWKVIRAHMKNFVLFKVIFENLDFWLFFSHVTHKWVRDEEKLIFLIFQRRILIFGDFRQLKKGISELLTNKGHLIIC